ncbi:P-loop containing nucleoside triphosphate hydrolase protein [Gymnopilus junonius]|uniref:P-loop containing nucleoside triphosphate hydrolase protein n=1 Tax=Gymnopilus junonius TaxID=109634 RepID=A0A9P5NQY3_GYMJU|nr:P-loop containing nucleoside triphosphate hydrolase protein [Gymnopilus junonius]
MTGLSIPLEPVAQRLRNLYVDIIPLGTIASSCRCRDPKSETLVAQMPCPLPWSARKKRWKILLVGDREVGKTSFAYREFFDKMLFSEGHVKECAINERENCWVSLLDSWIVQNHYYDLDDDIPFYHGVILFYSITSKSSFQDVARTCRQVPFNPKQDPNLVCILVGTKSDLTSSREVTTEEGAALAKELGCQAFLETSAKSGANVDAAVLAMVEALRKAAAAARALDFMMPFRMVRDLLRGCG